MWIYIYIRKHIKKLLTFSSLAALGISTAAISTISLSSCSSSKQDSNDNITLNTNKYYINWNKQDLSQSTFGINGDNINPAQPIIYDNNGLVYSSENRDNVISYRAELDILNNDNSIVIPSSVKQITGYYSGTSTKNWYGAFSNSTLQKISFSENKLISIGDSAFQNCTQLEEFYFPTSLKTIGDNAFDGSFNNQNANIQLDLYNCNKLTNIGNASFSNTSFVKIILPSNLKNNWQ
ncbi:MAG: leucine-rich repeat domain-containing protein [Ureaplasma sp.]|nr:leucine-rich repeat domain-containing protein [Ureaplasma sp.]